MAPRFVGAVMPTWTFKTGEGVFRTQTFSWKDHGYLLMQKYFSSAAECLEAQFNLVFALTYNELGSTSEAIDTEVFRQAAWFYVHRVFGICHDDYDYSWLNNKELRPVKAFIKKVVCTPEAVTQEDFVGSTSMLRNDEMCHVVLLALEARKQAALMYFLHALTDFVTSA